METKNKKLYIETLGCQMNKSDSERIAGIMSHFGYELSDEKNADFLIINTCSIRKLSEDKACSKLGAWSKRKKSGANIKIGICGCMAQREGENLLKKFPCLDLIFGTHNIYELPELLKMQDKVCAVRKDYTGEKEFNIIRNKNINAWLPIMEGCNNFCTYCIVPYTRGRERSRTMDVILSEAKNIINSGFKEITLLGQNVDSYGKDITGKPLFAELLEKLDNLEGNFRIRFTTSYPVDITDDVIKVVKNGTKICECFHIPMQSGNDRILKAMNRRYNVYEYSEVVKKIKHEIQNVTVTSDFIAGFPGETEEEFKDTINAIKTLELDYSNTAAYSPRPNTPAAKMTDKFIPDDVKKRRLFELNETVKESSFNSNKKYVGKTLEVLVEKEKNQDGVRNLEGRLRNNKVVHFKSNKYNIGDFVNIKLIKASAWCLFGEEV
ncbi:MAG: tRNA (N6-isopentenyl adenosine(37)-C2)-methylthiotransferase MiaB [Candidatus Gastranaerophilales bacterium]|nr:tRNA (N6-isopentenyl adenosine(37)-C2)-methylthiotransferase MiaB [Candidatus Gastranaerophilales bacterium]